jgi:outer membrane scaffolding protein for murein synthesis (MipA/OmpV family)
MVHACYFTLRIGLVFGLSLGLVWPAWAQYIALPDDAQPARRWGAAVGAVASVGPEYAGAARTGSSVQPGFGLRWGRVSLSSRSSFAVRSNEPAAQGGLRVELLRSERWRSSLGLRWDSGRDEGDSPDLQGLGDVRGTLRARVSLGYRIDDRWRLAGAVAVDTLGRGGGWVGQAGLSRGWPLSPDTSLSAGAVLGFAGARWQQNYFGITPEQSQRSDYAAYAPGGGLRDLVLSLGGRSTLTPRWAVFYGASVSRLVGPATASPLVRQRNGWGLSAGIVARL